MGKKKQEGKGRKKGEKEGMIVEQKIEISEVRKE